MEMEEGEASQAGLLVVWVVRQKIEAVTCSIGFESCHRHFMLFSFFHSTRSHLPSSLSASHHSTMSARIEKGGIRFKPKLAPGPRRAPSAAPAPSPSPAVTASPAPASAPSQDEAAPPSTLQAPSSSSSAPSASAPRPPTLSYARAPPSIGGSARKPPSIGSIRVDKAGNVRVPQAISVAPARTPVAPSSSSSRPIHVPTTDDRAEGERIAKPGSSKGEGEQAGKGISGKGASGQHSTAESAPAKELGASVPTSSAPTSTEIRNEGANNATCEQGQHISTPAAVAGSETRPTDARPSKPAAADDPSQDNASMADIEEDVEEESDSGEEFPDPDAERRRILKGKGRAAPDAEPMDVDDGVNPGSSVVGKSKRRAIAPRSVAAAKRQAVSGDGAPSEADQAPTTEKQPSTTHPRTAPRKTSRKASANGAPKRPQSAFFLYFKSVRDARREVQPEMSMSDLTRQVGQEWSQMDAEAREPFQEQAQTLREAYLLEKEAWLEAHPDDELETDGATTDASATSGRENGTKRTKRKKRKRREGEPKRPLSAYLLFVNEKREEKAREMKSSKVTEVTSQLAKEWKEMGPAERLVSRATLYLCAQSSLTPFPLSHQPYEDRATAGKEQYAIDKAAWDVAHVSDSSPPPDSDSPPKKRRVSRKKRTISDDEREYLAELPDEATRRVDPRTTKMGEISVPEVKNGRASSRTFELERVRMKQREQRERERLGLDTPNENEEEGEEGGEKAGEGPKRARSNTAGPSKSTRRAGLQAPIIVEGEEEPGSDEEVDDDGASSSRGGSGPGTTKERFKENTYAVQTRIVNGRIVLDEESLYVPLGGVDDRAGMEDREYVDEREGDRFVNSATRGKADRTERWTEVETQGFYNVSALSPPSRSPLLSFPPSPNALTRARSFRSQAISQWGTDFEMIARLFPRRTRRQIKMKWTREERLNPAKITEAFMNRRAVGELLNPLSHPSQFHHSVSRASERGKADLFACFTSRTRTAPSRALRLADLDAYALVAGVDLSGPPPTISARIKGAPSAEPEGGLADASSSGAGAGATPAATKRSRSESRPLNEGGGAGRARPGQDGQDEGDVEEEVEIDEEGNEVVIRRVVGPSPAEARRAKRR